MSPRLPRDVSGPELAKLLAASGMWVDGKARDNHSMSERRLRTWLFILFSAGPAHTELTPARCR
jgi:hypothetical protein